MRTIKFRVWDKEVQHIYPVTSFHIYRPEVDRGGEYCGVTIKDENGYDKFLDDERAIPMQFTGLLDKNGKEIYEGDLLRVKYTLNDGKDGQYVEGVHQVIIDLLRGLRLYYRSIYNPDEAKKNQYPISMDLCREHRTLDTDHRNNNNDKLAVMDSWGENRTYGNTWK